MLLFGKQLPEKRSALAIFMEYHISALQFIKQIDFGPGSIFADCSYCRKRHNPTSLV